MLPPFFACIKGKGTLREGEQFLFIFSIQRFLEYFLKYIYEFITISSALIVKLSNLFALLCNWLCYTTSNNNIGNNVFTINISAPIKRNCHWAFCTSRTCHTFILIPDHLSNRAKRQDFGSLFLLFILLFFFSFFFRKEEKRGRE